MTKNDAVTYLGLATIAAGLSCAWWPLGIIFAGVAIAAVGLLGAFADANASDPKD